MKHREWTDEEIQWLKENYPTQSDHKCRTKLGISYKRLWMKAEELGLEKVKPSDFEAARQVQVTKASKKRYFYDEGAQGYCQDCKLYLNAICGKTGKDVGALWQKKCFEGEV